CSLTSRMLTLQTVVLCIVVVTAGADTLGRSSAGFHQQPEIKILRDERQGPAADGSYYFFYETEDGISRQEEGAPQGETGAVAKQGSWSFTFPDGTPAAYSFIADENGYRVVSDLLSA
ncbi:hypothetical protein OTU49_010186, partial [Cherax quadricarinatus]